ncbi:T9SS type A sorting domain-containing protein [bacterium]|nr:T9SS type A sorting domain-containing protein [bacterium]
MKKFCLLTLFLGAFASISLALPTVDGDTSEPDYEIIATYTSGNNGFGSSNNIRSIKIARNSATDDFYIGIPCDLVSNDNVLLFMDASGYDGRDKGLAVGQTGETGVFGTGGLDGTFMDFEVDYAFSFNKGGSGTDFFMDAMRYGEGTPFIKSSFFNNGSGKSCNQSGTPSTIPSSGITDFSDANTMTIAYNNGGGIDQGIELMLHIPSSGSTALPGVVKTHYAKFFAVIVSGGGFFSDEMLPHHNRQSGNPGYDVNFASTTFNNGAEGDFFTAPDVPLPVNLNSFNAKNSNNKIVLEWIAESEINNKGFIVQRKTKNETNFTQIASYLDSPELLGRGNSPFSKTYTFVDREDLILGETYEYLLTDVDFVGNRIDHKDLIATVRYEPTINENEVRISKFILKGNFPNPFNPTTTIQFESLGKTDYSLSIFNTSGQLVRNLVSEKPAEIGTNEIVWDGKDDNGSLVSSGIYFYQLKGGNFSETKKMMLLK